MTVVVGIRGKNGVLLAADSAGSRARGGDQRRRQDAKVFLLSERVALACCGSYRMMQLLRYNLQLPQLALGADEWVWAVTEFVPAMRNALKDGGLLEINRSVESFGGEFLLAVRNRLFVVEGDLQVAEGEQPWATDGSGGMVAAGHLHAAIGETREPLEDSQLLRLARAAVASAADLNAFVAGGPVHVRTCRYTRAEQQLATQVVRDSRKKSVRKKGVRSPAPLEDEVRKHGSC